MGSAVGSSCLEAAALEVVVLRLDSLTPVEVQPLATITTEYIASEFIHLALFIGTLTTREVLLYQVKGFAVNNGFVGMNP